MSKPKISSEENNSEIKNKKRKADVSDIIEQQEKRIKKLESSLQTLTKKLKNRER